MEIWYFISFGFGNKRWKTHPHSLGTFFIILSVLDSGTIVGKPAAHLKPPTPLEIWEFGILSVLDSETKVRNPAQSLPPCPFP